MKTTEFLKRTFLFKGAKEDKINKLITLINPEIKCFDRNDLIYTPQVYEKKLGFVISGECEVRRIHEDGSCIRLNSLHECDSFGIISIFSDKAEYPAYIYSTKKCEICFISASDVKTLIEADTTVTYNLIGFLTGKIEFLNEKIATFSCVSVEKKLANYLISESKKTGTAEFELNKKRSAEAIGAGRASLYRAVNALASQNFIKLVNKKIYITDPEGLERILK